MLTFDGQVGGQGITQVFSGAMTMATVSPSFQENFEIGRVISLTFGVIGRNAPLFFGLAFVVNGIPQMGLQYLQLQTLSLGQPGAVPDAGMFTTYLSFTGLFLLFAVIFGGLLNAMLCRAAIEDLNDRRPQVGECFATAISVLLPLIAIGLVSGIAIAIGLVLLVVPGIYLALGWAVAVPVLVQEREGVFGSLSRSRALTKGSRWRLFAMFLVVLVVLWVLQIPLGLISLLGASIGPAAVAPAISAGISATLSSVFSTTIAAVSYIELRRIREGTSIDELAQIFA